MKELLMKNATILGLALLAGTAGAFAQGTTTSTSTQVQQDAAQQHADEHAVNVDKTNVTKGERHIVHEKNEIIHAQKEERLQHEAAQAAAARGDTAEARKLEKASQAEHQHAKVEEWKLEKARRGTDAAKAKRHDDILTREKDSAKRSADEAKEAPKSN
jgi:hypothetical protein